MATNSPRSPKLSGETQTQSPPSLFRRPKFPSFPPTSLSNRTVGSRQTRRIVVANSHGEKLVGILHDAGSTELAILCHGLRSSKERKPMVNLAAAMEKDGLSSFRFDFAGNGESQGLFRYGNYRREADDLRSIVEHFRGLNRSIIAIVGHSKGGNVVILYAAKYKDVPTVVNISGRFDLKRGIEGRLGKDFLQRIKKYGYIDVENKKGKFEYRVTESSLVDRINTDTRLACLSIDENCRVLTVHGSKDKIVPVEDASEFNKFIPNHKLIILDGADHEYTYYQDQLASVVLEFIKSDIDPKKDSSVQSRL